MSARSGFWKYFFTSQFFLALVILALLSLLGGPLWRSFRLQRQVNREITQLKIEIAKAESQNQEFKQMIAYLQSSDFVEKEARLNFGLKKPGEQVVVVRPPATEEENNQSSAAGQTLLNQNAQAALNKMRQWWDYFFRADPGT